MQDDHCPVLLLTDDEPVFRGETGLSETGLLPARGFLPVSHEKRLLFPLCIFPNLWYAVFDLDISHFLLYLTNKDKSIVLSLFIKLFILDY